MTTTDLALKITRALSGILISIFVLVNNPARTYSEALLVLIVGLLLSVLISGFFDTYKITHSIATNRQNLASVLELMADKSDDFDIISVVMRNGFSYIQMEKFPLIWLDVLWRLKESYHSTIISSANELSLSHNQLGLDIQEVKVRVNKADVRRVFIVDNEKHFSDLHQTMLDHKSRGLSVKYIAKDELDSNHMIKPWLEKAKALDFSIIDSKYVLLITSDENNHVSKFMFTSERGVVEFYKEFY